jgi:hypothetical protein
MDSSALHAHAMVASIMSSRVADSISAVSATTKLGVPSDGDQQNRLMTSTRTD